MSISCQIQFSIRFDPLDMEWYTWLHIVCDHMIRMLVDGDKENIKSKERKRLTQIKAQLKLKSPPKKVIT